PVFNPAGGTRELLAIGRRLASPVIFQLSFELTYAICDRCPSGIIVHCVAIGDSHAQYSALPSPNVMLSMTFGSLRRREIRLRLQPNPLRAALDLHSWRHCCYSNRAYLQNKHHGDCTAVTKPETNVMRLSPSFFLLTCAIAFGLAPAAHAEVSFSERPIRLIVPSSPGSGLDNLARTFAPTMGQALKQSVVVENLAGASNISGTRELVRAKPDGYTLELISSNHAVNPSLHKNLPYDSVKDLTPISNLVTSPLVLAVPVTSPYKTLDDLIAAAKKEPKRLN